MNSKNKDSKKKVSVVVLAAGAGKRFKSNGLPKQFVRVLGKPIFIHTLQIYEKLKGIDQVILVINAKYKSTFASSLKSHRVTKLTHIVNGGKMRHESIENALKCVDHDGLVVIHNAVNPTTTPKIIRACIKQAFEFGAASAYIRAFHTVFVRKDKKMKEVLTRPDLGYTSDPQACRVNVLKKIFQKRLSNKERDLPVVELLKKHKQSISLVNSDSMNYKLTRADEISMIKAILKRRQ